MPPTAAPCAAPAALLASKAAPFFATVLNKPSPGIRSLAYLPAFPIIPPPGKPSPAARLPTTSPEVVKPGYFLKSCAELSANLLYPDCICVFICPSVTAFTSVAPTEPMPNIAPLPNAPIL